MIKTEAEFPAVAERHVVADTNFFQLSSGERGIPPSVLNATDGSNLTIS